MRAHINGFGIARAGRHPLAGVVGGDPADAEQAPLLARENTPPLAQPLEIPHRLRRDPLGVLMDIGEE